MSYPAPKGNQFAKGNRGGGRKSAYQEKIDAEWHINLWNDPQDVEVLVDRIRSKKYSGKDMAAMKLLQGEKTIIAKFMDKLVPDMDRLPMFYQKESIDFRKLTEASGKEPLTLHHVSRFLEELLERVERGEMGAEQAESLGRLADRLSKSIELADLEVRVKEIERIMNESSKRYGH